jgi:hypothetical protein
MGWKNKNMAANGSREKATMEAIFWFKLDVRKWGGGGGYIRDYMLIIAAFIMFLILIKKINDEGETLIYYYKRQISFSYEYRHINPVK